MHFHNPSSSLSWRRADRSRGPLLLMVLAALLISTGCATRRVSAPAPVVDRSGGTRVESPRILPGAENAGKPGYYTVRPGDTLFRIAQDNGQSMRDLQAWNAMSNPNLLEVGQVLRVVPPVGAVATAPVGTAGVVARPLSPAGSTAGAPPADAGATPTTAGSADEINFIWPAQGAVTATFDEQKNKGVSIGGRLGDPVLAAADGRVVYAGAGLRGYGNLIILKHNNTYLTAYAHNQALLVREDQSVRQGQKIAEMGSSDTDSVKLHFEVRRLGKPVDPLIHLPKR